MEHLETVDEGTERAKEVIESNAGVILDAANEQENAECEAEELIDHPDFLVKDIDQLDNMQMESTNKRQYKKIELYSDDNIERMTLQLDGEQRIVLDIAVDYAKNIIKAKKEAMLPPKPPLLIVQGGIGTGKSNEGSR